MTDLETRLRDGLSAAADAIPVSAQSMGDFGRRTSGGRGPRRRSSFGFAVVGVAGATAAIVVAVAVLTSGGGHSTTTLSTNRTVSLTPATPLTASQLSQATRITRMRLESLGVRDATVQASDGAVQVTLPTKSLPLLTATMKTRGVLRFRQALSIAGGSFAATQTNAAGQPHLVNPGHAPLKHQPSDRGPAQAASLTPKLLTSFERWDCKANGDPTRGHDIASNYIIACDAAPGGAKYLLAPTAVQGRQVTGASTSLGTTDAWQVNLSFNGSGSSAWQNVTAKAYNVTKGTPSTSCSPPKGCNAVAIVLDGIVQSAPYISQAGGIAGGQAQISGDFTQRSASELAAVLNTEPLPTTFTVSDVS